ncbi:unnamed protein product [Ectocarpus sp. 6 AP-2014]
MMDVPHIEEVIRSSFEAIKGKGPNDRSLPRSFILRVVGLWLVDMMVFPSFVSFLLKIPPTSSDLGHSTMPTGFREWIADKTARPHRERFVIGAGVFTETAAVLMARARVAKLDVGAELARYLRAEVLAARGDDVAAPCAASMTPEIAGLGVVLTSVCEIMEARNAAEAGSGTEEAAGAGAAAMGEDSCRSGSSPSVPDSEEVATKASPCVAASFCHEEGEEEKRKEGGERKNKGAYGEEVGGWKEENEQGREQHRGVEKGVSAPAFDDAVEGEVAQESALVMKSHVQGRGVRGRCRGGDEASEDKVALILTRLGQLQHMVVDGFASLKTDQVRAVMGNNSLHLTSPGLTKQQRLLARPVSVEFHLRRLVCLCAIGRTTLTCLWPP